MHLSFRFFLPSVLLHGFCEWTLTIYKYVISELHVYYVLAKLKHFLKGKMIGIVLKF